MVARRPIDAALVDDVVAAVNALPLDAASLGDLRSTFPGVHFTWCFEDDVASGTPVRTTDTFHLYLVSAADHCLRVTSHLEAASGFLVAEIAG